MKRIGTAAIVILFVMPLASCSKKTEQESEVNIEDRAVRFVMLMAQGDFATPIQWFDSTMTQAAPPDKLEQIWGGVVEQAGSFKQELGVRTEKFGDYDAVLVKCEFERTHLDVKVHFDSAKAIAGLFFAPGQPIYDYEPPDYVDTTAFHEVAVNVGTGDWALPGTISMPEGEGPFAAVVLVHGSGPHDRDETMGPNRPFRDLAWGLASQGIAALRYEKRTKHHADKMAGIRNRLTVKEETVDDALEAVRLLQRVTGIDAQRIYVLGHSLGGYLVPRIGQRDRRIAGFIILAGSTTPMEDAILRQMTYIYCLDDTISSEEQEQIDQIKRQITLVKDPGLTPTVADDSLPFGIPAGYWLDLRDYNPGDVAKQLGRPILVVHGGRDYQVVEEDLEHWRRALSDLDNVTFKVYPDMNHLFIEGEGVSTPEEYLEPGHVAGTVVDEVVRWINAE